VRLIRLNAMQRATFEGETIGDRTFVKIEVLTAIDQGSEHMTRVIVDGEKIESICEALKLAAADNSVADLARS
jgi:hypothetical protein